MVLLYNNFITDVSPNGGLWKQQNVSYDRGNLNTPSKFEVLKYSLSSTAKAYPWKRAIIKIELDGVYNTEKNKEELKLLIEEEFKGIDVYFSDKRNLFQEDWVMTYNLINDEFILYMNGHDHVFFNSSKDYLKNFLDNVKEDGDYKHKMIIASHWCEFIRAGKCGYIKPYWLGKPPHYDQQHPTEFNKNYRVTNNFVAHDGSMFDSYNIITKETYRNWFLEGNWDLVNFPKDTFPSNRIEMSRTEGTGILGIGQLKNEILKIPTPSQQIYIPYEEIFKHFDGHFHQKISNEICPAIDIPVGYFDKKMKIRYGYDDYKKGWVNINPKNPNYYAHDKSGTDYKLTLDDLPYIWKDRIIEIDKNPNISEEEMVKHRLKSIETMIYNDSRYYPYIDDAVRNNVLNHHLQKYTKHLKHLLKK